MHFKYLKQSFLTSYAVTMRTPFLFLLLLLPAAKTHAMEDDRAAKLLTVVELQDQRRGDDARLSALLSDSDAVVRERACLACSSIQDTLILPGLLERLLDGAPAVREAAAFAIGQTGSQLSPSGKTLLEMKCLDLCTRRDSPPRLVEEMGKFGTVASLSQLTILAPSLRKDQQDALVMGIARYAIRGIFSDNSTEYLTGLAELSPYVSWQVVYALQRIAPHLSMDIQLLLPLAAHRDPLIRMNAASLIGKLPGTIVTAALLARLSADDPDWRVRVNATKAMGTVRKDPPAVIVNQFTKAFSDTVEHVALTAMATFGEMLKGSGKIPRSAEKGLWEIAENSNSLVSVRRQAEAITALAKIMRIGAHQRLLGIHVSDEWLQARYLAALGMTGDTLSLPVILEGVGAKDPLVAAAALDGMRYLAELNPRDPRVLQVASTALVQSLGSKDISVVSTAASMLVDSLFRTPKALPRLREALDRLHEPEDTEAIQTVMQTLGALRDSTAVPKLLRKLSNRDRTVAEAAASALEEITGRSYRKNIRVETRPQKTPDDSALVAHLPDTVVVHMQTSGGDVLLELYPSVAPYTTASFLRLAARKFFDGLKFHRVVPNFVVQGGDPRGDGWGGPGYSIRSEFSLLHYERGTVGMASAGKDTEGSQFFITHSPQPHLDGRYTIFGKVLEGMEVVDRLQVGDVITHVSVEKTKLFGD